MKNIVCRHIDQQSRCCTFSTLVAMWRWCLLAGLLAATASSESNATGSSYRLFNAYQAPLSALTSPGNLYFLEFPILGNGVSPMCGDGTPFSFAFRRGSDQHVSKLLIELEGGPACWGQDTSSDGVCCSSDAALQTPWYHFYTQQENSSLPIDKFPQLNTCAGITPGFAQMGSQELFRRDNKEDQHPADIPVFLRNDAATFGNPDEATTVTSVIGVTFSFLIVHWTGTWVIKNVPNRSDATKICLKIAMGTHQYPIILSEKCTIVEVPISKLWWSGCKHNFHRALMPWSLGPAEK
jgi:hypothetical protein